MKRLTILGGSSPFTVDLVDILAESQPGLLELMLQGRNAEELELVHTYARRRLQPLGWRVDRCTGRRSALEGASIVLQQIRFGGGAQRATAERLALSFGIAADETLGPAALQTALRSVEDLWELAHDLVESCPRAVVLNLTNPLSLVTSLLGKAGVEQVAGLCELPLDTALSAAALAGGGGDSLTWNYAGLNHRGFVFGLEQDGRPLFPLFLAALGAGTFSGASAAEIAELGAIPTKYFALLTGRAKAGPGRADAVERIRRAIAGELRKEPDRTPAGIAERGGKWYRMAVAPAIDALCSPEARDLVLSVPDQDFVSRELFCSVSEDGITVLPPKPPPAGVRPLLAMFEAHERAMLEACLAPSVANVRRALAEDPLVPADKVGPLAEAIMADSLQEAKA